MPIQGIPVPKDPMTAYGDTVNSGYKNMYMMGEMQKALAESQKSRMLANLLGGGTGGGPEGVGGNDINRQLLIAGMLGIHPQVMNGVLYSGAGNPVKIGESKPEERAAETAQKQTQEENKSDIDLTKKLEQENQGIIDSYGFYDQLADLHRRHPNLTGPGAGISQGLGLSKSKPLGDYQTATTLLQSALARTTGGNRGSGIGMINWAGRAKPSTSSYEDYNLGMIHGDNGKGGGKGILMGQYNAKDKVYFKKTGKHLNPPWSGNTDIVTMKQPNGQIVPVHRERVKEAKEKYGFKEAPDYD